VSAWAVEDLASIASTDDFHVAPYLEDGATPGTMIWVWSVLVGDDVYVRSATPESRWFAAAIRELGGLATGGRYTGAVTFELVTNEDLKDLIDEAYEAKYGADPYVSPDLLKRSRHQIAKVNPAG
jgi:hypothetical protein